MATESPWLQESLSLEVETGSTAYIVKQQNLPVVDGWVERLGVVAVVYRFEGHGTLACYLALWPRGGGHGPSRAATEKFIRWVAQRGSKLTPRDVEYWCPGMLEELEAAGLAYRQ